MGQENPKRQVWSWIPPDSKGMAIKCWSKVTLFDVYIIGGVLIVKPKFSADEGNILALI